jgi:hypothetical protein
MTDTTLGQIADWAMVTRFTLQNDSVESKIIFLHRRLSFELVHYLSKV